MPMNLDMNLDVELNQTNSCMLEQHLNEASGSADAEKGGFICGWRLRAPVGVARPVGGCGWGNDKPTKSPLTAGGRVGGHRVTAPYTRVYPIP
jgi:hypothetical protein